MNQWKPRQIFPSGNEIADRTMSYWPRSIQLRPIVDVPVPDRLNLRWVLNIENNTISMSMRMVWSMSGVQNAHTENYANIDNTILSSLIHKLSTWFVWFSSALACLLILSPFFFQINYDKRIQKILSSKITMINISLF